MATLTIIPDDNDASTSIYTSPDHLVSEINPMMYGGFAEHMGRCIYGGLYDPDNKHGLIDENGFRKDVLECLKELNVPVMRWPGGNFVATYHWMDGVGPKGKRPRHLEPAWGGVESNQFGTDEFMKWCKGELGAEPYIALNMGTGTLDEARAWLEYCNLDTDTYYANMRRANGHDKPYNVKYWALGNEMWGPWQVEQHTKEDYAKKACQWAKALKLIDPSIELILCGKNGHSDWDRYVLQECIKWTDMHSIHMYTLGDTHYTNTAGPKAAERAIEIIASLVDLARCDFSYETLPEWPDTRAKGKKPKICFDEWNVWDPRKAPGHAGGEQIYDLTDALTVAVWLNVFIRQSKHIGMATLAQSVNVISPLMTTANGIIKQSTYWPLLLFSKYMRGHTLATHVHSPVYTGPTIPLWLSETMDIPLLDVSASLSNDGYINLAVVNTSENRDFETAVPVVEGSVQLFIVGGKVSKLTDTNMDGKEKVYIRESKWNATGKFTFERHSFTLMRWKTTTAGPTEVYVNGKTDSHVNGITNGTTHEFEDDLVESIRQIAR